MTTFVSVVHPQRDHVEVGRIPIQQASRNVRSATTTQLPIIVLGTALTLLAVAPPAAASDSEDRKAVAALDVAYQKAVEQNDATTMGRILADNFVVVDGYGKAWTKTELIQDAKGGKTHYAHQVDSERTVRLWGDTAVVTAKLWAKGVEDGEPVDYVMWFSDTYVRTPDGWKYVFGQSSLPLPKEEHK
jgi:ketosteroid isomerase-like protein